VRLANWRRNSGQIATPGRIGQQVEVEDIVTRLEKRPLPPVAPLRYLVRLTGQHKSR
jgi:hypothetical protein